MSGIDSPVRLDRDALIARHAAMFGAPDAAGGSEAARPMPRIRERARQLGVSEVELVAAGIGLKARPLNADGPTIFKELRGLGRVMALTRNESCVHERHGCYEQFQAEGHVGLVLGPDIDLRVFFGQWRHGYAVEENGRASLQFFDGQGEAVHKIYRTEATDGAAWEALLARHAGSSGLMPEVLPAPAAEAAPASLPKLSEARREALRERWLALRDTHDFFPMLRQLELGRLEALMNVGEDLAQQVPVSTIEQVLEAAAGAELPIMCFVGNRGMIQIHSGAISTLRRTGPWYNVLDPMFNLHLNTTAIDSCWIVNKPSVDGWITSIEAFDSQGVLIVQFFGERKPGRPELKGWRDLVARHAQTPLRS